MPRSNREPRFATRTGVLVVVASLALLGRVTGPQAARASDQAEYDALAAQLVALIDAGDRAATANLFVTTPFTCPPRAADGFIQPACAGQPVGAIVDVYWVGPVGTFPMAVDGAGLRGWIGNGLAALGGFDPPGKHPVELASFSLEPITPEVRALCPACRTLVFANKATFALTVPGVMAFTINDTTEGLRLIAIAASSIETDDGRILLTGGRRADGVQLYRPGTVLPPATGSGLMPFGQEDSGPLRVRGTLSLLAALLAFAVLRRALRPSNREPRP